MPYHSCKDDKQGSKNSKDEKVLKTVKRKGEVEGEAAFFSTKRWHRRNRADLIESTTPCHDAQVVGSYQVLSHFA